MTGVDELTAFAMFDGLTAAQLELVASTAQDTAFAAGTRLFEEEQEASGCWLIRSGEVSLATSVPGRGAVVVQTLGPGDVLGWSWLVPPHRWHFTATATAPLSAIQLDTGRLRALAEEDPALGYRVALALLGALLSRLQSTRARLLDLYGSPRER